MPKKAAIPKSFRAMMQRIGLDKVKNSPLRRVESAAVKKVKERAERNGNLNSSSSDRSVQAESPDDQKTVASALDTFLMRLETPMGITDQLRLRGQEAMRLATLKMTQILENAKESTTRRAGTTPSPSGASESTSTLTPSDGEEHENVLHKLQRALSETKKDYNSRIPFDDRWDGIMSNLAVLGRTSVGNTVTPYRDSGNAFLDMWKAIDGSKSEVLWQTYICKDDFVGQTTIHRLAEAHTKRNCTTELLYDCGGNISGRSRLTEELKQCGATVIPYRPFFHSCFEYAFKGFDWRISPGLRNHRKILLVDKKIGFCGGLNIGNEYCGPQAGGTGKFRDTHCSVVGPAVSHLREVYDDTKEPRPWKYSWARWRQIATVQLNRGYETGKYVVEKNVLQKLHNTSKEVRRRGGVYFRDQFRKAEDNTSRVLQRLRWQKQAKKSAECEKWNDRKNGDGRVPSSSFVGPSSTMRVRGAGGQQLESLETQIRQEALRQEEETFGFKPAEKGAADEDERVSGGSETHLRTGVMRRKVTEARIRALFNASDIPHKRSYTAMLLELPISDNEPVPEAEMYCLRRQSTAQVLSCNPRWRDYSIQYAFWQVTRKCHRRIWITTPYYLPTKKLFHALLHAASRGVDVRILSGSNQTTDPWFMWHASNYITERLLRSGVKIYEYKGSQIMHAKTVVADSVWASIGSYNWDVMSNKNLEVCLCQLDFNLACEMEKQFLQDVAMSEEIYLEEHKQRSLFLRFTSWLFYNIVFLLDRITFRSFANQDLEDSAGTHRE